MIETKSSANGADVSAMRTSAVCISRSQETWEIQGLPFYNYTEGWKPFQHEQTRERVSYLAGRRNAAVARALGLFPDTEYILMIDSYYLHQPEQVIGLLRDYVELTKSNHIGGCILGASTWFYDQRRIMPRYRFYDSWTTPEGIRLNLTDVEHSGGTMKVKSVGACYVYPRWVWEKVRYDVLEDLHGCEHNWLCEHSGLPVYLSLSRRLSRGPVRYPWTKRIRVNLHMGRLLGR
jgi:hypothetical protein